MCMGACEVPAFVALNSVSVVLQALKWVVVIGHFQYIKIQLDSEA